jgi:menaquinone-dependent protoporphyrinogen oxidase
MKILVTAASKHGATSEIATWIGEALTEAGMETEVRAPGVVASLSDYDAVILGSAVYAGRWLDPATDLVKRLREELRARPVWLFSSGPVGDPARPETDPVDVATVQAEAKARGHVVFAGRVDRKRLGFAEWAIVAALRVPDGDFRDQGAVRTWATEIATELATPVGATRS